jgi:dihydrofolate synthase/folylpolyglutamate synthase
MTYAEAIKFLLGLQMFGARLGLENTLRLAALAGNPQEKLRFIHVAGTNGKGSTCAMLESIYRAAGLRTGLYTSPHLVHFGERIQVDRQPIGEADIARLASEMKLFLAGFPPEAHPTFFEVVTVMALRYFAEQKCELVIWETGLGGRLDATNIVTPLASVITNIQFDHQAWLGDTLPRIAAEKAGIIKPGVPVITAVDDRDALRVLFETARALHSPFSLITRAQTEIPPLRDLELPLPGKHQRLNAAVAVYTARAVADKIPVSDETIRGGLQKVKWAGRLQLIERIIPGEKISSSSPQPSPPLRGREGDADALSRRPPYSSLAPIGGAGEGEGAACSIPTGSDYRFTVQKILLDGAHNIGGAEALRAAWLSYFPTANATLILGVLRDKDYGRICEILAPLAGRILLVPIESQRTALPHELAPACRAANPRAEIIEAKSLAEALKLADRDPLVVIAGSLYLIGEALELLKLSTETPSNERNLNEWTAKPSKK